MLDIAIVAFKGISLFHLSVPVAIFQDAVFNDEALFNVHVCAETPGKISTSSGIEIEIKHDISMIEHADIVIIPSWLPDSPPGRSLIDKLNNAHRNGKLIAGLCLGAYAIAYSGLLNEKRATTHWKYGEHFRTTFPNVTCDINPLFIVEDNIITSAGSAAAIDCCLHIVKRFYGVKTANKIARVMVSSPERSGGQRQYIEHPVIKRPADERLAKLIDTVVENISDEYSLASAAEHCMMSVRSFSRHFKSANGISFTAWLVNVRLQYSLELLESTDLSITETSELAGFSSEQLFRKHFKQRFGATPGEWRVQFKGKTR